MEAADRRDLEAMTMRSLATSHLTIMIVRVLAMNQVFTTSHGKDRSLAHEDVQIAIAISNTIRQDAATVVPAVGAVIRREMGVNARSVLSTADEKLLGSGSKIDAGVENGCMERYMRDLMSFCI